MQQLPCTLPVPGSCLRALYTGCLLYTSGSCAVDIGKYGTSCLRHTNGSLVSDVCGHGCCGNQTRSLTDQCAYNICTCNFADFILDCYTAVFYEERCAVIDLVAVKKMCIRDSSSTGVPIGTRSWMGCSTSPTTERYFSVTAFPSRASAMFSTVPTLSTTHPTSDGSPRSGTHLPVTC